MPVGQVRTQRELILLAVDLSKREQLEVLLQGHIPPNSLPCWDRRQRLINIIQERANRVEKAEVTLAKAQDDLADLRKDLEGVVNQIDAHHREEDARRERRQGNGGGMARGQGMEGVVVVEADSSEEVGVKVEPGKKREVGKGWFGGGSGSAGRMDVNVFLRICMGCRRKTRISSGKSRRRW